MKKTKKTKRKKILVKPTENLDKQDANKDEKGRWVKGVSGNPNGRPKGTSFMDDFIAATKTVEKAKRKTLLEHFIEQAFCDTRVLIAYIDRILPQLKAVESTVGVATMTAEEAESIREKLLTRFE